MKTLRAVEPKTLEPDYKPWVLRNVSGLTVLVGVVIPPDVVDPANARSSTL